MHYGGPRTPEKNVSLKRFLAGDLDGGKSIDYLYSKRQCVATYGPSTSGCSTNAKISGGGNTPFSK